MPVWAIDAIRFSAPGADEALVEALRGASPLLQARREGVNDPQELFAIANSEYGRQVGALYAAGHYSGVVEVRIDGREAAAFSPLELPQDIREISITVHPGPAFTFARAEVVPMAPGTDLPEEFAPGRTARSPIIRDTAQAVVDGWRAQGHAKATEAESRITADHRDATLDALLRFTPGPQLRFGRLIVEGNERTRAERVRQIAGLPEGEVFNPEAIERAARRLRRTGTFGSVAMSESDDIGADDTLDITATLIEAPLRRIGFGAELDTVEGVRLSAFWLHRNLLGGAERLRLDGEIGRIGASSGGRDYRFAARFSRPATFTPETTLSFGGELRTVDVDDYDSILGTVDVGVTHFFSDRLTGEAGIAYLRERTEDAAGRRTRSTLALPIGVNWDRRDSDTNATSGTYIDARATPFLGLTGADSGAQFRLDGRAYYGVGAGRGFVLAGRVQLGSVVGASIEGTPRDYLFYSGGGGTVRGQPYRSLGVNVGGVGSGGRSFAALSAEVRARVTENIGVVGFADAGLVGDGSFGGNAGWHAGAGLGVRYATGIGPIRLDVGFPVRGDTGDGAQLYIGIGQAF
ncbi:autotransporter assembly complex protein TamA [Alkalilacustris brevis]|uniref:autotransporter assembly complex protein TamA n=1 Tax=Alkalilacustris brevis TaxID=2026338 RepID=UPI001EE4D1E3|nr:BamA/TamA family outer membrane protein [Alkalilacustris brevis]